ncbi:MAG TPA: sugar nucleotide-binding protein [Meiothermus sp.]|nr:sugar nucleotide-binding protein [Meiothermus sp.]
MRPLVTGASRLLGQHLARLGWRVSGTFRRSPLEGQRGGNPQRRPGGPRSSGPAPVRPSDALFDGTASPYPEEAPPAPITPYGASKAAAEAVVQALYPQAVIVRTSLILSKKPLDKHSRMALEFAHWVRPGALFTDEVRCPIGVEDLAAVLELAGGNFSGILNVAGPIPLSRYALGRLVLEPLGSTPAWPPRGNPGRKRVIPPGGRAARQQPGPEDPPDPHPQPPNLSSAPQSIPLTFP